METISEELVDTDVLIAGGGIAGCMAAIKARELGVKVTVAEKGNTLRSGMAATGNDHFLCYIPDYHGPLQDYLRQRRAQTRIIPDDEDLAVLRYKYSADIAKLWHSWGIPMKTGEQDSPKRPGEWFFSGHMLPGRKGMWLKIEGRDMKPILTREVLRSGAKILNRVMITELLTDNGRIVGALGITVRDPAKVIVFRAKSVILAAGGTSVRMYPGVSGTAYISNSYGPPTNTGDGNAMALRAGATIVNAEFLYSSTGNRYWCRAGKGTWPGVVRDSNGKTIAQPHLSKPNPARLSGDPAVYDAPAARSALQAGRGPIYMDMRGIPDDDWKFMKWGLTHEGNSALVDWMEKEGIDVEKTRVEWMPYPPVGGGNVRVNAKMETSVGGLYYCAMVSVGGWIASEEAAKYAKEVEPSNLETVRPTIEKQKKLVSELLSRETGATWKEVQVAFNMLMRDYVDKFTRSEAMLNAALKHLSYLRELAINTGKVANAHELMRFVEVLNMIDLGEAVALASRERRETRFGTPGGHEACYGHYRVDYPEMNPLLNKFVAVTKVTGKLTAKWATPRRVVEPWVGD